MHPFIIKTPKLVHWLFPKRVWAFSRSAPTVYLTFDDGPIPGVTPWVLDQLRKHNARATFFCIGENMQKHPEIAKQILEEGHTIGNHTFHHKNGWKTSFKNYTIDVETFNNQFSETFKEGEVQKRYNLQSSPNNNRDNKQQSPPDSYRDVNRQSKTPFRPPYGKMTSRQAAAIQKLGHKIIMWDVLSGDYDQHISEEKCLKNVLQNIKQGSIVVFHDSLKAEKKLKFALPKVLEHIKNKGWSCKAIT